MTAYEAYEILNRNPTVMQAKVLEACRCSGAAVCGVGDISPTSLFDPTSRLHDPETIDIVESQGRQTWDQTRLASQATLDAIKSSLDQLARRPGKRMLLLASAGFLSGTLEEQQDAIINLAVRGRVVINALDAKGLYAEAPGPPITNPSKPRSCRSAAPYSRFSRSANASTNSTPPRPDLPKALAACSSAIIMISTSGFANWGSCPAAPTCLDSHRRKTAIPPSPPNPSYPSTSASIIRTDCGDSNNHAVH